MKWRVNLLIQVEVVFETGFEVDFEFEVEIEEFEIKEGISSDTLGFAIRHVRQPQLWLPLACQNWRCVGWVDNEVLKVESKDSKQVSWKERMKEQEKIDPNHHQ